MTGYTAVGGIAGTFNQGVALDCGNHGAVNATETAGGLVGSQDSAIMNSFNTGAIAGGTGASLVLSNVQTAQAGGYYAVVTNSAGSATSAVAMLAVEGPPVVWMPAAPTTPEDATLVFSAANGNAISLSNASAGTNSLGLTLSVSNGTATLNGTTGLTFSSGDGLGDTTMVFRGALTDLNAALSSLAFLPAS